MVHQLVSIRRDLDLLSRLLDELETGGVTDADLSEFDIAHFIGHALTEGEMCQEVVDAR